MQSPWRAIHPDNLEPITAENIHRLVEFEGFHDQVATLAYFDPSGQFLITDTSLNDLYSYDNPSVVVTNLRISCEDHDFMVFDGDGSRGRIPEEGLRSGYIVPGSVERPWGGMSRDGEWLIVPEVGSFQRYDTVHRIQLRTGQDLAFPQKSDRCLAG